MKKLLFIVTVFLGLSFTADAQKKSGTYLQVGTSVDHHNWTQEVQFGGYAGKHQFGALLSSIGEAPVFDNERPWYGGVAYQFAQPVGKTVDFLLNAEGKVDLRNNNNIILEPGLGLAFKITPKFSFQTGVSTQFNEKGHHSGQTGQFDVGFNVKF